MKVSLARSMPSNGGFSAVETTKDKAPPTVAVSISESPDMRVLGFSSRHFRDAMAEVALRLLSAGASLAYGGDLRHEGLIDLLSELIARYRGHPDHCGEIKVTDYLAWPMHIGMAKEDLEEALENHGSAIDLILLAEDGTPLEWDERMKMDSYQPSFDEWSRGLTNMRNYMQKNIDARVVLGGKTEGYRGCMPGIAEETYLSLKSEQPIFLLGGFGGCARDIAQIIGLLETNTPPQVNWNHHEYFEKYHLKGLHNGLADEENILLAKTPHIQRVTALLYRGMHRTFNIGRSRVK